MRSFFKLITASCLGTILAFAAIFMILAIFSISSANEKILPNNTVLHLKLNYPVLELTDNIEQAQFSFEPMANIGIHDMRKIILHAATDPKVKGILLQTEMPQIGTTQALEIASYLREFKKSGKFLHAYGDYFSQTGYIVASVADSVYLNPNGALALMGYGSVRPYYKDFSKKTGITFDVYHAGKFKSAIEPFYRSSSSEENRLQTHVYLDEYMERASQEIGKNRNIPAERVEKIIKNALASEDAQTAMDLGLVDRVTYWQDYEAQLKEQLGSSSKLKLESLPSYKSLITIPKESGTDRIAIIYAEGEINMSGDDKGKITMERYRKALEKVRDKDNIKALVLRVNSPGGSAFTSDDFWSYVEDIKAAGKYVVASFGTYAASGGYYISCGADYIVSEPTTLTGSIGVFSMIPDFSTFSEEKLGINWDTISTGNYTFMYSPFVNRGPAQDARLMSSTDHIYQKFLQRVADGRGMTKAQVHEVGQGRVWSGEAGLAVGLVDTLGNLQDAIDIAAAHIGTDSYKTLQYPVIKKSIYEEMLAQIASDINSKVDVANVLGLRSNSTISKTAKQLHQWIDHVEQACETPQARLPFMIIE